MTQKTIFKNFHIPGVTPYERGRMLIRKFELTPKGGMAQALFYLQDTRFHALLVYTTNTV